MGGRWRPGGWERILLQLVALVVLVLMPLLLILAIPFHICRAISDPHKWGDLGIFGAIILGPFILTGDNCWCLAQVSWDRVARLVNPSRPRFRFKSFFFNNFDFDEEFPGEPPIDSDGLPFPATQQTAYRPYPVQGLHGFRLLGITPGSFDEELRGTILSTSLMDQARPSYDALSYTWADETCDAALSHQLVLEGSDGAALAITKNCDAAIRRLRQEQTTRYVWIDAVCIDQSVAHERTHQVSLMSMIYTSARTVVVYTGEATTDTDALFDWLNDIDLADIKLLPSASDTTENVAIELEWYWKVCRRGLARAMSLQPAIKNSDKVSEAEITDIAIRFFERRWFHRVWVLQEAALPSPSAITIMCGAKAITAALALQFLSLLHTNPAASMLRIFFIVRTAKRSSEMPHLLDVLIETRDCEASDPRDKIFGVLSIAKMLDKGRFPELAADYSLTVKEVYSKFSKFFIRHHGPSLFLALIKPASRTATSDRIEGLPSWAADWTADWPNCKVAMGRDFAVATRIIGQQDKAFRFAGEGGQDDGDILVLVRSRIIHGCFTTSGHVDGDSVNDVKIQRVEDLQNGLVLIELYPRLAALLQTQVDGRYIFLQTCPHGLVESSVYDALEDWSGVVLDAKPPTDGENSQLTDYLEPPVEFLVI